MPKAFRVSRGRPLSSFSTLARSRGVWTERSVDFGKYWRSRPLTFSLEPRCQGLAASQKKTFVPIAAVISRCRAISVPWSHVRLWRSPIGSSSSVVTKSPLSVAESWAGRCTSFVGPRSAPVGNHLHDHLSRLPDGLDAGSSTPVFWAVSVTVPHFLHRELGERMEPGTWVDLRWDDNRVVRLSRREHDARTAPVDQSVETDQAAVIRWMASGGRLRREARCPTIAPLAPCCPCDFMQSHYAGGFREQADHNQPNRV